MVASRRPRLECTDPLLGRSQKGRGEGWGAILGGRGAGRAQVPGTTGTARPAKTLRAQGGERTPDPATPGHHPTAAARCGTGATHRAVHGRSATAFSASLGPALHPCVGQLYEVQVLGIHSLGWIYFHPKFFARFEKKVQT